MLAENRGTCGTILAATELPARADRALRRAALPAAALDGRLTILHAVEGDEPRPLAERERPESSRRPRAQLARLLELGDLRCETRVESGDPLATILRVAERDPVDGLAGREHRRGRLRDLFTGACAGRVLRRAPCPVLMLRQPPAGPDREALVVTDFCVAALWTAQAPCLLDGVSVTVAQALEPPGRGAPGDAARRLLRGRAWRPSPGRKRRRRWSSGSRRRPARFRRGPGSRNPGQPA